MLGALPAIGFLSVGTGMGIGQIAAYGAIAGFSATLTGPPNLSTGGQSNNYDYLGSNVSNVQAYSYLGTDNVYGSPGYTYTGQGNVYPSTGYTYTGVNNINPSTGYGFTGVQNINPSTGYGFTGVQNINPSTGYSYLGLNNVSPTQGYSLLGSEQSYNLTGPTHAAVWNWNAAPWNNVFYGQVRPQPYPTYEFPYNGVQYQQPASYPAQYGYQVGSYDVSQSFGNGYVHGSVGAYQNQYASYGFPPQQPYGQSYGYPAYGNPPSYAPAYQPSQTYALQAQQAGMASFGAQSSYQAPPPLAPALDSWARVEKGKVAYPGLPSFEATTSWVASSQVVALRVVGGDANQQAVFHFSGNDPTVDSDGHAAERTTVWWALQQNDRLRFNAGDGTFFETYPDGSTRPVDTLANLLRVRQASGWDGAVAYQAFGDHLQEIMVTNDLITPPYQPGASALTTRPFGTQWDLIFPRPDNTGLYGFTVPNQGPSSTSIPASGLG